MDLRELPAHAFRRHPWENARAHFFIQLLREHARGPALSVVDFGSGDGFFARRMLATWPAVANVVCFDPGYPAEPSLAGEERLRFTRTRPEQAAEVLVLLDVLEHVANDQATLHEALSCLRPGGLLLLSVPAHAALFSRHDLRLGHKRRYSPAALLALAGNEGLAVLEHGQLFASLLLPRALTKLREMLRPLPARPTRASADAHVETMAGSWRGGPTLSRAIELALGLDAACARALARKHVSLPGLSTWLLARKP